jgi:hypothetical protein
MASYCKNNKDRIGKFFFTFSSLRVHVISKINKYFFYPGAHNNIYTNVHAYETKIKSRRCMYSRKLDCGINRFFLTSFETIKLEQCIVYYTCTRTLNAFIQPLIIFTQERYNIILCDVPQIKIKVYIPT